MKRLLSVLAVALTLLSASACSSAKPPAVAAVQGNKTIAALKDLSSMYEKKNLPGFMSLISDNFKGRKKFTAAVGSVFSKYDTVHFTVQFTRMFITIEDKGMTRAAFNWDSGWETAGGTILKNSGRATFVFEPKEAKLVAIDGKNPFIPQEIEPQKQ